MSGAHKLHVGDNVSHFAHHSVVLLFMIVINLKTMMNLHGEKKNNYDL